MDKALCPAYAVLRSSAKRLLMFLEAEIARGGGAQARVWNDTLEMVGSRRVVLPGLAELQALGWIELARHPKYILVRKSHRWHEVATMEQAMGASAAARAQGKPPLLAPAHVTA